MKELVAESTALVKELVNLLHRYDKTVQGLALAELTAYWLARNFSGESDEFRERLLTMQMKAIRELTPAIKRNIFMN